MKDEIFIYNEKVYSYINALYTGNISEHLLTQLLTEVGSVLMLLIGIAASAFRVGTALAGCFQALPSLGARHQRSFHFKVGILPLDVLSLVMMRFTFADTELDLHLPVLPIK